MKLFNIIGNIKAYADNKGERDYFCRIDNTRFFKHFNKSADEFITDKNGKKVIEY